jgi:integrase
LTSSPPGWRKRPPPRPATVTVALRELRAAGLASIDHGDPDGREGCWPVLPAARHPLLDAVELHGAHDFRHTFSTWLEDAGIPARVIDELMGHEPSRGGDLGGSRIGARYRHTTPEMAARVTDAVEQRLAIVLRTADAAVEQHPNRAGARVF